MNPTLALQKQTHSTSLDPVQGGGGVGLSNSELASNEVLFARAARGNLR